MALNAAQLALENAVNQDLNNFDSLAAPLDAEIEGVQGTIDHMASTSSSLDGAGCTMLKGDVDNIKAALAPVLAKLQEAKDLLAAISVQRLRDDLNGDDQFGKVS